MSVHVRLTGPLVNQTTPPAVDKWHEGPACCLCDGPGAEPKTRVCRRCLTDLPWNDHACLRCALPLPSVGFCSDCLECPPPFARCTAALVYDFPVAALVRRLKDQKQLWIASTLARLLAQRLPADGAVDGLLPVPSHRRRHLQRGYNQAALLARELGRITGLPVLGCIRKHAGAGPQRGRSQRARQLRGAQVFTLTQELKVRHPAIVDDVMTTGATVGELARVVRAGGACAVDVWVVARTPLPSWQTPAR